MRKEKKKKLLLFGTKRPRNREKSDNIINMKYLKEHRGFFSKYRRSYL